MGEEPTYIGIRNIWGGTEPFGLSAEARRQHTYIIGKTGTGKSALLRNVVMQDIALGRGVAVVDPHGDLAEELLDAVPRWRTNHVVYIDPSDSDHSVPISLFEEPLPERRHLVASSIVAAFKSVWRESWGPRLEYVLYAAIAALQECQNISLLGVPRMLVDDEFRAWVVRQVRDPIVRSFWIDEFERYDRRFAAEVIAPVQNKVGQLLMAAPLRNVLGQATGRFNCRFAMDRQHIVLINLSKGRLGEDKSNLLGSLLVNQFRLAALARADTTEARRIDFHLFVDEFHNFATDGFAGILSEARKYRLCLTLAHQYTSQLSDEVRNAVFGNVGTIIAFRVGESDASIIAREYGGELNPGHFTDLSNHEIRVKLLAVRGYGDPFLARTLPPIRMSYSNRKRILQSSRERYGIRRAVVEARIEKWRRSPRGR